MHKLYCQVGNEWVEPSLPRVSLKNNRIETSGDISLFKGLVSCFSEPVLLLYVLHTPRGEAAPGRYQSPELSTGDFEHFISKYAAYLTSDSRFDIWAHSPHDDATVVWDRHNKIFAYGPIPLFSTVLHAQGFEKGTLPSLGVHQHHYREEFDSMAQAILAEYSWAYSPLHPEDEQ